jgi:hypothetical protein
LPGSGPVGAEGRIGCKLGVQFPEGRKQLVRCIESQIGIVVQASAEDVTDERCDPGLTTHHRPESRLDDPIKPSLRLRIKGIVK